MNEISNKKTRRADDSVIGYGELAKKIPTCILVDELKTREGVEEHCIEPYEETSVKASGPARVLVVTD